MQCKLIVNSPVFTWTLLVRLEVNSSIGIENDHILNRNTRDIRTYAYHFCKCHIYYIHTYYIQVHIIYTVHTDCMMGIDLFRLEI